MPFALMLAARTTDDIQTVRHVFLDFDSGGQDAIDRLLNSDGIPNPHHVLCTSPGKHQVIWQVEAFTREDAESVVKGMSLMHAADAAVTD